MSKNDSGDFDAEEAANEGIEKHDEYVNNAETDEDGNLTEDIDEYYERKEEESKNQDEEE